MLRVPDARAGRHELHRAAAKRFASAHGVFIWCVSMPRRQCIGDKISRGKIARARCPCMQKPRGIDPRAPTERVLLAAEKMGFIARLARVLYRPLDYYRIHPL